MKKKIYALMLVVAMLAMTLVACGSDTNDTTNTTNEVTINTEVEESGDDVVVEPTEEPTVTPEVEEPVVEPTPEEVVDGENDKPLFAYSSTFVFPDDMEGFTRKFLNEDYPEWSINETHYIDINGNEMNFTWEGPAGLGSNAGLGTDNLTLIMKDTIGEYALRAWNGGELKLEELEECLTLEKSIWTSLSGPDTTYPEDGYYNIERVDNIVYVTHSIVTDTMTGYAHYLCNGDAGNYYMFVYLENTNIYDDARAMNVINSIEYWNYIPEETTIE